MSALFVAVLYAAVSLCAVAAALGLSAWIHRAPPQERDEPTTFGRFTS